MLFETLNQVYIFLGAIYFGLLSGIIRDITLFISQLFKKNYVVNFILDVIFSILGSLLFIICINLINFGEFRFYLLFSYVLGFILERKSLGFLVDFIFKKIYNFSIKVSKKISNTKFFKKVFKNDRKKTKNIIKSS